MIRFGDFELDLGRQQLRRAGEELRVEPKVLGVIGYLTQHRDRIVTKEELLENVWSGKYVSESALTRVIRDARRALGDSSAEPRWIRTIYGKGFHFIGAIEEGAEESVGDDRPSIAVLPFADLSAHRDQAFFCEGLADEIINALTKLERLDVISRKSSVEAARGDSDPRSIARRLGVTKILEGSVRKAGERLRVVVHLVDVSTGRNLWSERYDRAADDIFAIQEEIAEQSAVALLGVLGDREQGLLHQRPHAQLRAWEHYLKARQLAFQEARRSLEAARQTYEQAVAIDPEFALAWSGMADALSDLYLYHAREDAYRDAANEASRRAIELDPRLPEAHVSRGLATQLHGDYEQASTEFETAIALDPRSFDAHHLFARLLWTTGQHEASVQHLERAAAIRPDDYVAASLLVQAYYALGRESDRHNAALRSAELTRKRLELRPDDLRALCANAEALFVLGDREAAQRQIDLAYTIDPDDVCTLYNSACVFALEGSTDRALDAIEGAVRGGYGYREWLEHDADFAAIRNHPRFRAIVSTLPPLRTTE